MNESTLTISDRLLDLLVDEATGGLGDRTSARPHDIPAALDAELEALMQAATIAQLGFLKLDQAAYREMPAHLRRRILAAAGQQPGEK